MTTLTIVITSLAGRATNVGPEREITSRCDRGLRFLWILGEEN